MTTMPVDNPLVDFSRADLSSFDVPRNIGQQEYDIPHQVRAIATDSVIEDNRRNTPQSAINQRKTPRLTISELNDMDMDEVRKRYYSVPIDTRGPVTRFLDMIDLPRNVLFNMVARDTARRKLAEGDTAALGLARVNTSDVLQSLGMRPGLVTGVLGFVGDVALDPLTYAGPAGWGAKMTSASGKSISFTKSGSKAITEAIKAAGEGRQAADAAVRSYLETLGHTAESIASAADKKALSEQVAKNLGVGKQGRFNKIMSWIGEDAHYVVDDAEKSLADHIDSAITSNMEPAERATIEAAQKLYGTHGRPFSPGIRVVADKASPLGFSMTTSRNAPHGSGIFHIPGTAYELSVPPFTAAAAQQAQIASLVSKTAVANETFFKSPEFARVYQIRDEINDSLDAVRKATDPIYQERLARQEAGLGHVEGPKPDQYGVLHELPSTSEIIANARKQNDERIRELAELIKKMDADPNVTYADMLHARDLFNESQQTGVIAELESKKIQAALMGEKEEIGKIANEATEKTSLKMDALEANQRQKNVTIKQRRKQVVDTARGILEKSKTESAARAAANPASPVKADDAMEAIRAGSPESAFKEYIDKTHPDPSKSNVDIQNRNDWKAVRQSQPGTPEYQEALSKVAVKQEETGGDAELLNQINEVQNQIDENFATPELTEKLNFLESQYADTVSYANVPMEANEANALIKDIDGKSFDAMQHQVRSSGLSRGNLDKVDLSKVKVGDTWSMGRPDKYTESPMTVEVVGIDANGNVHVKVDQPRKRIKQRAWHEKATKAELSKEIEESRVIPSEYYTLDAKSNVYADRGVVSQPTVRRKIVTTPSAIDSTGIDNLAKDKKFEKPASLIGEVAKKFDSLNAAAEAKKIDVSTYGKSIAKAEEELQRKIDAVAKQIHNTTHETAPAVSIENISEEIGNLVESTDDYAKLTPDAIINHVKSQLFSDLPQAEFVHDTFGAKPLSYGQAEADAMRIHGVSSPDEIRRVPFGHGSEFEGMSRQEARYKIAQRERQDLIDKVRRANMKGVEEAAKAELDSIRAGSSRENARRATLADQIKTKTESLIKEKTDAIQKRSAEEMDVLKRSADGEGVGTAYPERKEVAGAGAAEAEVKPQEVTAIPHEENLASNVGETQAFGTDIQPVAGGIGATGGAGEIPSEQVAEGIVGVQDKIAKIADSLYETGVVDGNSMSAWRRVRMALASMQGVDPSMWTKRLPEGYSRSEFMRDVQTLVDAHKQISDAGLERAITIEEIFGQATSGAKELDAGQSAKRIVAEATPSIEVGEESVSIAKHTADEQRWQKANEGAHTMEADEAANFVKKANVDLGKYKTFDPAQDLIDIRRKWGMQAIDDAVSPATKQRMDEIVPGWKDMNPYQRSVAMQIEADKAVAAPIAAEAAPAAAEAAPSFSRRGEYDPEYWNRVNEINARRDADLAAVPEQARKEALGSLTEDDLKPVDLGHGTEYAGKSEDQIAKSILDKHEKAYLEANPDTEVPKFMTQEEMEQRAAEADYLHAKADAAIRISQASMKPMQAAFGKGVRDAVDAARVAFGLGPDDLGSGVMASVEYAAEYFANKNQYGKSLYEQARHLNTTFINRFGLAPGIANDMVKQFVRAQDIYQTQSFKTAVADVVGTLKAAGIPVHQQTDAHKLITALAFIGDRPLESMQWDAAGRLVKEAIENGLLRDPAMRETITNLANKYRGILDNLKIEGGIPYYVPNVPTTQAENLIRQQKANRVNILSSKPTEGSAELMTPAQKAYERFEKPRGTLEHVWTDAEGTHSVLESELAYTQYTDADLYEMEKLDPDMAAYYAARRDSALRYENMSVVNRAKVESRYLSPHEINERVSKQQLFKSLTNNALNGNDFFHADFIGAVAARLGAEERKYARNLLQSYLAPYEINIEEEIVRKSGIGAGGSETVQLANGTNVNLVLENGKYNIYIGNIKYTQPKIDISSEFAPVAEMFGMSGDKKLMLGYYPEAITNIIEDTAGFFGKPGQGSGFAKAFGLEADAADKMTALLKGADKISGYWKVFTLLHPSWTINDIIGNLFLMANMGINPITAAKKAKDTFIATKASANGDLELLRKIKFNGKSVLEHMAGDLGMIVETHGGDEVARQLRTTGEYIDPYAYSMIEATKLAGKGRIQEAREMFANAMKESWEAAGKNVRESKAQSPFMTALGSKGAQVADAAFNQTLLRRVWQPWAQVNGIANNWLKMTAYFCLLDAGYDGASAARLISEKMLDMSVLTNSDRSMRTLIPFWNWMKNSGVLGAREFFRNPKFFGIAPKVKHALEQSLNGEQNLPENARPSWIRDQLALQIGTDPDTRRALTLTSSLPTEAATYALSFMFSPFLGSGAFQDSLAYVTNSITPVLKTPLELGARKEFFTKRSIDSAGGDITPTEYLIQQVRPFREFGVGSLRGGPIQRAFGDSAIMGISRATVGGRLQPFDEERRVQNLQREFDDRVDALRRRIGIAEREGQKNESLAKRVELLRLFNQMEGLGLTVPKWASRQNKMLKQESESM